MNANRIEEIVAMLNEYKGDNIFQDILVKESSYDDDLTEHLVDVGQGRYEYDKNFSRTDGLLFAFNFEGKLEIVEFDPKRKVWEREDSAKLTVTV